MQISRITTGQPNVSVESGKSTHPQFDSDVAELKRKLISGELSDTERLNIQTLLRQAERAMKNGNEQIARQFIDRADESFKEEPKEEPGTSLPDNAKPKEPLETPTNEKRIYQDASNDTSVSFKYPTPLNKYQAAVAIPAHENEHVQSAVFDAQHKGVLARIQVRYRYGIDSSGKRYLKGGNTYASIPGKKDTRILSQRLNSRVDITI